MGFSFTGLLLMGPGKVYIFLGVGQRRLQAKPLDERYNNGFKITWILHKINMLSNKVNLVAG